MSVEALLSRLTKVRGRNGSWTAAKHRAAKAGNEYYEYYYPEYMQGYVDGHDVGRAVLKK